MKTRNYLTECIAGAGLVLLATGLVWSPRVTFAQEKGATLLVQPSRGHWQGHLITTPEDVAALKDGDMVAMACPKCKTITITTVKIEKGHIQTTTPGEKHLCPGCDSRLVTEGTGHQAKTKLVHVCKACGSEDAFCCAMKKGEGPTQGMEQK